MPRKEKVTLPHSKSRIAGYRLKPEQVHKSAKIYDRKKIKKETKEALEQLPSKSK